MIALSLKCLVSKLILCHFVAVGAPIPVEKVTHASQEQVDALHFQYVERLKQLFYENRDKFGVPASTELNIY